MKYLPSLDTTQGPQDVVVEAIVKWAPANGGAATLLHLTDGTTVQVNSTVADFNSTTLAAVVTV